MAEMSYIIGDLTFIYTSFAKIFCQNKIKKNCNHVTGVSIEKAGIRLPSFPLRRMSRRLYTLSSCA